jgi:hypothetical protein
MIGTTADHVGLRVALGIPLVGALVVIALAGSLNRGPTDPGRLRGRKG